MDFVHNVAVGDDDNIEEAEQEYFVQPSLWIGNSFVQWIQILPLEGFVDWQPLR